MSSNSPSLIFSLFLVLFSIYKGVILCFGEVIIYCLTIFLRALLLALTLLSDAKFSNVLLMQKNGEIERVEWIER